MEISPNSEQFYFGEAATFEQQLITNGMRKVYKVLLLLVCIVVLGKPQAKAQATDYKFHTVFIYNFTKYIKWPDEASSGNFVIGILGKSGIADPLKEMASSKTVNGRTIEIKTFNSVDDIKDCHMLFLPQDKSKELASLRTKFSTKPLLIISEKPGLAQQGSDINFIMNDGRWKFEVNQATTELHKLKISQELIKFALKVYTEV